MIFHSYVNVYQAGYNGWFTSCKSPRVSSSPGGLRDPTRNGAAVRGIAVSLQPSLGWTLCAQLQCRRRPTEFLGKMHGNFHKLGAIPNNGLVFVGENPIKIRMIGGYPYDSGKPHMDPGWSFLIDRDGILIGYHGHLFFWVGIPWAIWLVDLQWWFHGTIWWETHRFTAWFITHWLIDYGISTSWLIGDDELAHTVIQWGNRFNQLAVVFNLNSYFWWFTWNKHLWISSMMIIGGVDLPFFRHIFWGSWKWMGDEMKHQWINHDVICYNQGAISDPSCWEIRDMDCGDTTVHTSYIIHMIFGCIWDWVGLPLVYVHSNRNRMMNHGIQYVLQWKL